jgi:uncharacterized phage protein gp47/JayE
MALSFDDLLTTPTKESIRAKALQALQGVGFVSHSGFSPGTLALTGIPTGAYSLRVKVVTAGVLGTAQVKVSTDGALSYGSTQTVPSNGILAVAGTGVSLQFANGNNGTGAAFLLGDVYSCELTVSDLPVTAWQAGSVPLTDVELLSLLQEDQAALVKAVAAGGFLTRARGPWLDLLAPNVYFLTRNPGVTAKHLVTFTAATGAGPYAISPGQLWVASTSGLRFNTEGSFTIPLGGSVQATVRAEQPGAAYNVANGTITTLVTSLPGVTVNNPNPGSGTSLTVVGADDESDDNYIARCKARWPSLGTGQTAAVVDLWARTASLEVTRTKVRPSPSVEGQFELYLAGSGGPVSGGAVTAVTNYLATRLVLGTTALVQAAAVGAYTVTATLYVHAGYETQAALDAAANMDAFNQALAIGDTIYLTNIIEQLSLPAGVRNVSVSLPVADVVLGATAVGVLTLNLTVVSVP